MKNSALLPLCLCLGLVIGCGQTTVDTTIVETKTAFNQAGLPTVEISMPGLHCESCKGRAERLIQTADGVDEFNIDLSSKTAIIAYNTDTFDNASLLKILSDGDFTEASVIVESVGKSTSPLEVISEPTEN